MTEQRMLTVGELARRAGVAPSALRFYEANGLIHAERNSGNQRRFRPDALRRVAFIRAAQVIGLSLSEITAALRGLSDHRTPTRADWNRLATHWSGRIDQRLAELALLRERLDGCIGCGCLSLTACALYNHEDRAGSAGSGARYLLGDEIPVEGP